MGTRDWRERELLSLPEDLRVTGVIHSREIPMLVDHIIGEGIDIHWEEHCRECEICNGEEEGDCEIAEYWEDDDPCYLLGFKWNEELHQWEEDLTQEWIVIMTFPYTQIVKSPYLLPCHWCSPCYPGQGDLDSPYSREERERINVGSGRLPLSGVPDPLSYLRGGIALAYAPDPDDLWEESPLRDLIIPIPGEETVS